MKFLIVFLTAGVFFLNVFSPAPARAAGIDLTFQGDVLSANLKEVRLKEILEKLEREKGISWKGDSSLLEEKITVQFKDLFLDEGVKRILHSMNHYLLFDANQRLAGVIIVGVRTGGQVISGKIVSQKKRTHGNQASKADEITKASGRPVAVTKKDHKVMRNIDPPGASSEPSAEQMEKFKIVKDLPPPGGSAQVSQQVLDSFKVIKNISPPGDSTQISQEVLDSFKVRKNLPPPGN